MARGVSFAVMAARVERWATIGISYAAVEAGRSSLEKDARETRSRIKSRSGKLAASVRVVRPSSRRAARTGTVRFALAAGSRSSDPKKRVLYAGIIQEGGRTFPHLIKAREGRLVFSGPRGAFVGREVMHTGARFAPQNYARVDENRLAGAFKAEIFRAWYEDKILADFGISASTRPEGL